MTPRQFADLAVAVSRHAEEFSSADGSDATVLHRVWKRSGRWFRTWREELVANATPRLYAELFSAELPLRVWCTAVAGGTRAGGAVAAKIFADLLETRCMALQALAADYGLTVTEAATVDRFRRRCERWGDVLVGPVAARTGVSDYAIRPDRAADFGTEADDPSGESSWSLVTAGLRLAFAPADDFRGPSETGESAPAADQLAAAILATFPASAFGVEGLLRAGIAGRAARVVEERRPAKTRRRQERPAPPVPSNAAPIEVPRPASPISFASLRKRRSTS